MEVVAQNRRPISFIRWPTKNIAALAEEIEKS